MQKHRKVIAYPREDFIAMIIAFCKEKGIKYCSAPFEADWQLVSLQKQGIIQQFYVIGTALATTVPVMGWTPLKSLEQLGPFMVFIWGYSLLSIARGSASRNNYHLPRRGYCVYIDSVGIVFFGRG